MIICINGFPRAGKDTFCNLCEEIRPTFTKSFSTVDFVKDIARQCGWDGTKTENNRKFLADLKELLVRWDNVPYKDIVKKIELEEHNLEMYGIDPKLLLIFVHVREPQEIKKFVGALGAKTLLIKRSAEESKEHLSSADSNVYDMTYDYEIVNDGSIEELKDKAKQFINMLEEEELVTASSRD